MVRIFLRMLRMLVCRCRRAREDRPIPSSSGNTITGDLYLGKALLTIPSSACCDRRWVVTTPVGIPSGSGAVCSWCPSTYYAVWCSPLGRDTWLRDPLDTWTLSGTFDFLYLHPPSRQIAFCWPKQNKNSEIRGCNFFHMILNVFTVAFFSTFSC